MREVCLPVFEDTYAVNLARFYSQKASDLKMYKKQYHCINAGSCSTRIGEQFPNTAKAGWGCEETCQWARPL